MPTPLVIEFDMWTDPVEGADQIIASDRDIAKDQQAIEMLEDDLASGDSILDDMAQANMLVRIDIMKRLLRKKVRHRDRMLPHCKHFCYTFLKPTYKQQIEAEEAARHWDKDTGLVTVDEVKKIRQLVRECLQIPKDQIDALDPVPGRYIQECVSATLGGGNPLLPFTLSPQETH